MIALPALCRSLASLDVGRVIEVGFRLMGWSAVSLLAAAGLFVFLFAAFGSFTLEGFFFHIGNLAAHYATADVARRSAFQTDLMAVVAIATAGTMFFRRGSLARVFAADPILDGAGRGN